MMWTSVGLLLLRLGAGGFMLYGHGWSKLTEFADKAAHFPDPLGLGSSSLSLGLAVLAEVVCALALVAGLLTRYVAGALAFTMMVAVFVVHGDDPWAKKELAALYLVPYLTLIFTGGGRYALDIYVLPRRWR